MRERNRHVQNRVIKAVGNFLWGLRKSTSDHGALSWRWGHLSQTAERLLYTVLLPWVHPQLKHLAQRAVMNESVSPGKGLCLALCCIPRAWLGGCAITGEQGWKGNSTITFHFNGHLSASKHMAAKKQYWKGYRQNIKVIKWLEEDVKKDSLRKRQ